MMRLHRFQAKAELYESLAAEWLAAILADGGGRPFSFALAGGTTPAPVYQRFAKKLSKGELPAALRIKLVATDERWVPNADAQSNEGLIERCFQSVAREENRCSLVSLKTADRSPAQAAQQVSRRLDDAFPGPFSAVLLGMGTDGHIASIFPGDKSEEEPGRAICCLAAQHPVTGQARMSLSMRRLLHAERVWLVITGDEKLALLRDCERGGKHVSHLPIARFLQAADCPVDVYWSPDQAN